MHMKTIASPAAILADQRGTALVLVLVMLAVLLILGSFALTNSSVDVKISGNYRASNESLFAAERGLQVGLENLRDDLDLEDHGDVIRVDRSGLYVPVGNGPKRDSGASFITNGPPPVGSGMDATTASGFQARYYAIEVHGQFPQGAPNAAHSELEMQASRIVAR
ncbi:PilX N-terminal domain-containing pilus assembly protein [Geoalkalibacter halelectricus]|uniref:PilX N-terminal domain-containing pilus assembly protein n=1 Tax=Geoalkalibacter halelectricus TaxID=2847045 RepID=A0ABY5ZK71_9BACT|nr:PilX N-terminal domain-containing pilus assembly protein [Geoalkalibacter halelectricus]MDO3376800.1 PilX N-terminal domain-containing pilus assembly protein [Geoalkalibacter halelectricus]UWZ79557.1 PilX N-terminal domain-containing pilus assembly protein [Geoalkalibacter halelectricus]